MENLKYEIKAMRQAIKYKRLVLELSQKANERAKEKLKLSKSNKMSENSKDFNRQRSEIDFKTSARLLRYFNKL